jgi:hypothetical protein
MTELGLPDAASIESPEPVETKVRQRGSENGSHFELKTMS